MYFDINGILKRELESIEMLISDIEAKGSGLCKMRGDARKLVCLYEHKTSEGFVYYGRYRDNGKQRSVKLGGPDNTDVIRIKQMKFNKEILRVLKLDREMLRRSVDRFISYDPESIEMRLKPVYRDNTGLVDKAAGIISNDEWEKISKRNRYELPDECNRTIDGLKTRSKSEVIVYSILKGYGMVIKTDMEITLKNELGQNVVVSPDFIILCDDGSLIIIEHLGMLDNVDYLEKAIKKIHLYHLNGYTLNDNLFLTADSSQGKIDAQAIDELVRKMILPRAKRNRCRSI